MSRSATTPGLSSHGFTLIELLVVTVILSIAVSAIAACLAAGIRIFESSGTFGASESRAHLAFMELERDLRNSVAHNQLAFEGDSLSVRFAGTLPVLDREGRSYVATQEIAYEYDRSAEALIRRRKPLTSAAFEMDTELEVVLSRLRDVRFEFLDRDSPQQWQTEWNSVSNRPVAVKVLLVLDDASAVSRWQRLVSMPVSGLAAAREEEAPSGP